MNIRHAVYFITLMFLFGFASPDEKANKLFVEASQLIELAQSKEKAMLLDSSALRSENIQKIYDLYNEASQKLNRIVNEHSSSRLAVEIIQDKVKIKGVELKAIPELVKIFAKGLQRSKIKDQRPYRIIMMERLKTFILS